MNGLNVFLESGPRAELLEAVRALEMLQSLMFDQIFFVGELSITVKAPNGTPRLVTALLLLLLASHAIVSVGG